MILVTGASGNAGSQVLNALLRASQPVTAMYRSQAEAGNAPGGVKTVVADFGDPISMDRALQGIDKVYLVCAPVPQLVELETRAIESFKKARIQYLVLTSALGAGTFNASFPSWHGKVEATVKTSGIPHTIVRPNSFMQNILAFFAPTIRTQGVFYSSMGKAPVSFIDTRDIGEFIAALLTKTGHEGKTYELNGPEALTYDQVAEQISEATGKPARYVDIPPEQQRQSMQAAGMPDWQIDALLDLQRYYTEGGGGNVDDLFQRVVGREPKRLAQFLKESAGEFVDNAKSA